MIRRFLARLWAYIEDVTNRGGDDEGEHVDTNVICVDPSNATNRQILLALLGAVTELESTVAELSESVESLQQAVSTLGERVESQVAPLQEALAAAQQELADFTLADEVEDENFRNQINELTSSLAARVDEAQEAAAQIEQSVGDINRVGRGEEPLGGGDEVTEPDAGEPVTEPEPVEPTEPGEEPHPDNTLPGDLPQEQPVEGEPQDPNAP